MLGLKTLGDWLMAYRYPDVAALHSLLVGARPTTDGDILLSKPLGVYPRECLSQQAPTMIQDLFRLVAAGTQPPGRIEPGASFRHGGAEFRPWTCQTAEGFLHVAGYATKDRVHWTPRQTWLYPEKALCGVLTGRWGVFLKERTFPLSSRNIGTAAHVFLLESRYDFPGISGSRERLSGIVASLLDTMEPHQSETTVRRNNAPQQFNGLFQEMAIAWHPLLGEDLVVVAVELGGLESLGQDQRVQPVIVALLNRKMDRNLALPEKLAEWATSRGRGSLEKILWESPPMATAIRDLVMLPSSSWES